MGVINKFFGRFKLTADPTITTQSVAVVEVQDTNTSIVLKPNGTGGIIASVPDGTATGGNARGSYAVDLQMSRTLNTQVANGLNSVVLGSLNIASNENSIAIGNSNTCSGFRAIAIGNSNTASNNYCLALGGNVNRANGNTHATVVGGLNNTASGQYSGVYGGDSNTASSNYSVVSGGQSNTASTNTHATVVGGQSNTASGQHSVSGGNSNTASGAKSVALGDSNVAPGTFGSVAIGYLNTSTDRSVALGYNNTVSALGSLVVGAQNTITSAAQFSFVSGNFATAYLRGQVVSAPCNFANSNFATKGDAQQSTITAYKQDTLTTAATTVLSLDGTGTTNLIIPNGNNRAWNVQIDTIAVVTAITGTATGVSVGDCYRETKQLLFKRIGGTSSIVGTVDTTAVKSDTSMSACAMTITAGASQEMALTFTAPTFTGGGSVTCRVVSKVALVEVAY